jgi:hypothetical protein
MHGVHHELQSRINNGTRFFRIKPFDQGRGAFEVGKQRRDGLALAICCSARCHRGLLGANTFREVGRRIARRGLRGRGKELGTGNWRDAGPNEYLSSFIDCDSFRFDELSLQALNEPVIDVEANLERLVGQTTSIP